MAVIIGDEILILYQLLVNLRTKSYINYTDCGPLHVTNLILIDAEASIIYSPPSP